MNERPRRQDLRVRFKKYALSVIRLYPVVPKGPEAQVLGRQLLRSATSPGAHYREACRARSDAEFISKMEGGLQELDESAYWLELLMEAGFVPAAQIEPILAETDELIRIVVSCVRSIKGE